MVNETKALRELLQKKDAELKRVLLLLEKSEAENNALRDKLKIKETF